MDLACAPAAYASLHALLLPTSSSDADDGGRGRTPLHLAVGGRSPQPPPVVSPPAARWSPPVPPPSPGMDAGALLEYVRPALCAHEAPDVVRSAAGALERAALLATAVAGGPPTSDRLLRARWVPLLQSVVCDSAPLPWPP